MTSPRDDEPEVFAEMVAAPDGKRWVVEARRPRAAPAVALLVVRTLAGAEVFREVLGPDDDPAARVRTVAESVATDGWPPDRTAPRVGASTYWSPMVAFALWLVGLTPAVLLAWIRWAGHDAGPAWPVVMTVVWVATGAALALVNRH